MHFWSVICSDNELFGLVYSATGSRVDRTRVAFTRDEEHSMERLKKQSTAIRFFIESASQRNDPEPATRAHRRR
jgi:hypothetical protein